MNLPRLAVQRPVTTLMALLSVLVVGGIAVARLPLAYLPEVDVPFIGIRVPYPNSSPQQVEKEITKPVEEVLATLSRVKKLNSSSRADGAEFWLEFDWGQELDLVRMQVSEKMDQIEPSLPDGVGEILIYSFNTNDIPVLQGRVSARGVDLSANYELLEARVLNRIRRVPGVARVDLDGVAPREITVDLILDKVAEHGVDVGELMRRLQGASANLVLGEVHDGGLTYTARALGGFRSVAEIRDLAIDERGLRVSDIAEVTYEEPPIPYGRHLDGRYAVALTLYKESTANTVDVVRGVTAVIEGDIDRDPLLEGVSLFVWEDQAEEITNALSGLTKAGVVGALLATLCLYFFLRRLDSTLIVSLSIPFSILAACGVLFFLGKSLNILSMMGLMLGVGMLVDNAVVVLESIDRTHRTEPDRQRAALLGSREVALAVAASTLTTLIVFLPLIVGSASELTTWLGEVGITISIALVCSLFSSLTLIPLVSAHFLAARRTEPGPAVAWLEERYDRALGWTLRHRGKTFALLALALVVGFLPLATGMVESGMFSARVNKRLYIAYEFADFAYKRQAEKAVDQVEAFFAAQGDRFPVRSVYSYFTENEAGTTLVLSRQDLSDRELKDLRGEIREALPEIPGVELRFEDDADEGGGSTYFAVRLFGQDSGVLERLAREAARRLETVPGVEDVRTSAGREQREIQVRIDRDKAARLGLTAGDLSDLFAFTLGGARLPRLNAGDREIETWLALRLEDRESIEDLKQIQITAAGGRPVRLGDIASFEAVPRAREIRRENRKVRLAVNATYEGEDWERTREEIAALMDAFDLPSGYSWSWNERILEQETQDQQMGINFLLALLLVYIVMASLFESLAQPFAILFSIPFALPGAAWLLAATGTPFNLMAQIGLLILMGIVVNNGIVLLDRVNQYRRDGLGRDEAILAAGRDRLRPILMTATTTIIGLLPLALGGSAVGSLMYFPLARTVMGGLMSSAVLTLLALPLVTLGVEGVADWARRVWRGSGRAGAVVQAAGSMGAVAQKP